MNYLTRNAQFFEEMRNCSFSRGEVVGRSYSSNGATLRNIGSFKSTKSADLIYAALKEKGREQGELELVVEFNLLILNRIYTQFPALKEELPLFYGVAKTQTGKIIGEVFEDYSKNGSVQVWDVLNPYEGIPNELRKLWPNSEILDEDLGKATFFIGDYNDDKRKIGDLESLAYQMKSTDYDTLSNEKIENWLNQFSITIDF